MNIIGTPASLAAAIAGAFLCAPALAKTVDVPAGGSSPSADAQDAAAPIDDNVNKITAWITASHDNNHAPFIVIDKVGAKVFVFDSESRFVGETPALLGIARGDDSAPGVGTRKLSAIAHHDRTTPAGRFVAKIGMASGNHEVLWVDYPTSISLHPVVTSNKREQRVQRLNSPSPKDNRITFGCINVPAAFYKDVVRPLFKRESGVVYILPETKPLGDVFLQLRGAGQAISVAEGGR